MTDEQFLASTITLIVIGVIIVFLAAYAGARFAMRPRKVKPPKHLRADLKVVQQYYQQAQRPATPAKPQKLTRSEKRLLKEHPRYGHRSIKTAPGPRDWSPPEQT